MKMFTSLEYISDGISGESMLDEWAMGINFNYYS